MKLILPWEFSHEINLKKSIKVSFLITTWKFWNMFFRAINCNVNILLSLFISNSMFEKYRVGKCINPTTRRLRVKKEEESEWQENWVKILHELSSRRKCSLSRRLSQYIIQWILIVLSSVYLTFRRDGLLSSHVNCDYFNS